MTYDELLSWVVQQTTRVAERDEVVEFTAPLRLSPKDRPSPIAVRVEGNSVYVWDAKNECYTKGLAIPKKSVKRVKREVERLRLERLVEALSCRLEEFVTVISRMTAGEIRAFVQSTQALPAETARALYVMLSRDSTLIKTVTETLEKSKK